MISANSFRDRQIRLWFAKRSVFSQATQFLWLHYATYQFVAEQ